MPKWSQKCVDPVLGKKRPQANQSSKQHPKNPKQTNKKPKRKISKKGQCFLRIYCIKFSGNCDDCERRKHLVGQGIILNIWVGRKKCDASEFHFYEGLITKIFGERNSSLMKHELYLGLDKNKKKCLQWKDGMGEGKYLLIIAYLLEVKI